jgi:hypothetical protein
MLKSYLAQHPNVRLHFTPAYSSWLNQVESWSSKLQRDLIDRGIFTSVADLRRKIMRYIRLYQKTAKPFQWKYSDVRQRIPAGQRCLGDNLLELNSAKALVNSPSELPARYRHERRRN